MRTHERDQFFPGNLINMPQSHGMYVCQYCVKFQSKTHSCAKKHMIRRHTTRWMDDHKSLLYCMALRKRSDTTRYGVLRTAQR